MMNLELVGVSLYSAVSLIGAFFFCVACRYAVCFAFFTLPTKVPDRARASFSRKPSAWILPEGLEIFTETSLEFEPVIDGIYLCSTKKRNCVVIGDRNEWRQSEKGTATAVRWKPVGWCGRILKASLRNEGFRSLQSNSNNQQKALLSTAYPRKVHGYKGNHILMDFSRRPI